MQGGRVDRHLVVLLVVGILLVGGSEELWLHLLKWLSARPVVGDHWHMKVLALRDVSHVVLIAWLHH